MSNGTDSNRVYIFDTTLRDGEQSPGASMNLSEKLRIAEVLEDMGVDIIEAGFPIASEGDFEAVNEIAKVAKDPPLWACSARVKLISNGVQKRETRCPVAYTHFYLH